MKPVALIEYPIGNSSKRGDIVLDLFGGSGSTLIACESTGRVNRSMELDPRYVDVIIRRWQDYTGRDARLESTGATFGEICDERIMCNGGGMPNNMPGIMVAGRPYDDLPANDQRPESDVA